MQTGREPVAHLAAAQEVGQELEAVAVPGVEVRAGRWLAIELLDDHRGDPAFGRWRLGGLTELGLENAGRPEDANDVNEGPVAETENEIRGQPPARTK